MATAETKTVTVEKVVFEETQVINLELTLEEAQVLRDIYHCGISGDPYGRRKLFKSVAYALDDAGITPSMGYGSDNKCDFTGSISFSYDL